MDFYVFSLRQKNSGLNYYGYSFLFHLIGHEDYSSGYIFGLYFSCYVICSGHYKNSLSASSFNISDSIKHPGSIIPR